MARRSLLLALALAAGLMPASAALSPFWQRIAELRAIIDDLRVAQAVEGHGDITSVGWGGVDTYEVRAGDCTLAVKIIDIKPPPGQEMKAGPRQFDLKVSECK